jgi:hypothetical protein
VRLMSERSWDKALLDDLTKVMADASICGLGQAAMNPVRQVIEHFPDEVGLSHPTLSRQGAVPEAKPGQHRPTGGDTLPESGPEPKPAMPSGDAR